MSRWALLLHELPDASWHFDWLIQPNDTDRQAPLVAFRMAVSPIDPAIVAFPALRIADHRPAYLDYEGEVSGNRGRVRRVAQGEANLLQDGAAFVVVLNGRVRWTGHRDGFESPRYQFHLSDHPEIGHTGQA
jgi:hypothetical protein